MINEIEQQILKYKNTGDFSYYPFISYINKIFPFGLRLMNLYELYEDSLIDYFDIPKTKHQLEYILKNKENYDFNKIRYSLLDCETMKQYDLFEKLIYKSRHKENVILYISDLIMIANYKPEILTKDIILNNILNRGFHIMFLYYVAKGIISEDILLNYKYIELYNIEYYIVNNKALDDLKNHNIDYAPIKLNESKVYSFHSKHYHETKNIIETDGEYYLIYEDNNMRMNFYKFVDQKYRGYKYLNEEKDILKLLLKYMPTELIEYCEKEL